MTALMPASSAPIEEAPFDLCGDLPTGTTVLEASAGTGKTYTLAALAARYVAEGHATLPQLMLVAFGREATRELRERVRERLTDVERALADPDAARRHPDTVTASLASVDDAEVRRRRVRLAEALAHFDAATIATTHQFCQEMLAGLGIVGDTDPEAQFVEQIDDVITEVVDDFYVRAYGRADAPEPHFARELALGIGRAVIGDPEARIAPGVGEALDRAAGVRANFARKVREEVERRKRGRRLYTYDDMLTRLHRALTDPRLGDAACRRLRSRFSVVLVDEFQDTDPIQWDILRVAFHGTTTLTFIGDPKQAIYGFRGADVVSYLAARRSAGTHATLATNYRSDAALLRALDTLWNGTALGDERIVVRPVAAAHQGRRLHGAPCNTPLRLRVVPRAGLRANWGMPAVDAVRDRVAADVAADTAALLAAPSTWTGRDGTRDLGPGDVAVLVRTNAQGALVRDALAAAGVPAVFGGTSSVFATVSAADWLTLLEAVEQPGRTTRIRAAAVSCFLGRTAAELDADPDAVLSEVGELVRRWGAVLRDRGVAAFLETLSARTGLPARLLATAGGERRLTDIRHIGQVLHAEAVAGSLGVVAIVEWLALRMAEAPGRSAEPRPERSRRLESDADAVQVLTVHKCKGLEFPVVHVPFGWDRWVADKPEQVLHHDADDRRVRAVGGVTDPGWADHVRGARREEDGEDLRLLYVALTRAQGQLVLWWAPSKSTTASAVHRLLFGRPEPGTDLVPTIPVPDDAAVWERLAGLAGPEIAVEPVDRRPATPYMPPGDAGTGLVAARFDRALDLAWRRSSYSSLTAAAHEAPEATSEPEEDALTDEAELEIEASTGAAIGSPMADLPVGAAFGVLVHTVLETADTTAPDLAGELERVAGEALARRPIADVDPAVLARALFPVVQTPLGLEQLRLRDLGPRDRLAELDFELPLAGGDRGGDPATVTLAQVSTLLRRHLTAEDPLAAYPDALAGLGEQVLRGYLTGSIDAVLRTPSGRFVVVDYKTNWLGPIGPTGPEPLTSAHYGPTQLAAAMIRAHYPLQALLYAVALHRYLRWRLPGYAPEEHLGGVRYLFLRGMCGAGSPVAGAPGPDGAVSGVFGWSPPPELVVELSTLLDGGAS